MRTFLENSDDFAKPNVCCFGFSDVRNESSYNPIFDMRSGMNWQDQIDQISLSK